MRKTSERLVLKFELLSGVVLNSIPAEKWCALVHHCEKELEASSGFAMLLATPLHPGSGSRES